MILCLILFPVLVSATTYYIDATNGDNTNSGTSQSAPWKTISKVNSERFSPGDQILFKRGETWREQLNVPSSGNSTHRITFGAYGTGSKPKILGSEQITGWTVHSGNQWRAPCSPDPGGGDGNGPVWFLNTSDDGKTHWGNEETSLVEVDAEYDWYWEGGYLYVYSPSDPDTRYDSIEAAWRWHSIRSGWNRHYVTIENIHGAFTARQTINDPYWVNYWIIDSCYLHHSGCSGCPTGWAADNIKWEGSGWWIKNNVMHDGPAHNMQHYAFRNVSNDLIEYNKVYNAHHASIDVKMVESGWLLSNVTIRYNTIYNTDDYAFPEVSNAGISVQSNFANGFDGLDIYGNIFYNIWTNGIWIYTRVKNVNIYNNVIYGKHPLSPFAVRGINIFGNTDEDKPTNVIIKNNIIAGDFDSDGYGLRIRLNGSVTACDYNCFYITSGHYAYYPGATYDSGDWNQWKTKTGFDTHSLWNVDPEFVNPLSLDFHLQPTSPCIDKGTFVGLTIDYEGNPVPSGNGVDIGVYEYPSSPPPLCTDTCMPNDCSSYIDCYMGSGFCSGSDYCCSGTCQSHPTCSSLGGTCCQTEERCSGTSQTTIDCTDCCTSGVCQPSPCPDIIMLHHYDNDPNYGESPTNMYDFSLHRNNGTCSGAACPTWNSSGMFGGAFDFDGIDDRIDFPSPDPGFFHNAFSERTFIAWIKTNTVSQNQTIYDDGGAINGFAVKIDDSGYVTLYTQNNDDMDKVSASIDTNWHFIAASFDNGNLELWVDGNNYSATAAYSTISSHPNDPGLGRTTADDASDYSGPGHYFNGKIDDLAIWKRSLTSQEISDIYNSGNPIPCQTISGDLNNDGTVDIADLTIIATNFGRTSGFDLRADTDRNNEVDIFDIVFVASRFT